MSKLSVLVIGGGPSLEREISLLSSKSVFDTLKKNKYNVNFYDWDGTTDWLNSHLKEYDVALPILHGVGGEDGQLQHLLEEHSIPFLGSSAKVSQLCFDKQATLECLRRMGIPTPQGKTVNYEDYLNDSISAGPHVLKPFKGGSSIDTFILPDPVQQPLDQIKKSFEKYETMLLEEYLDGIEITVPILGDIVLPVIEIQPPKNGVFDYANKYNGKTAEFCPPKNLSKELQRSVQDLALKVHAGLGCRHLSRIDMIIVNGKPYVLETNTLPGMTSQSLYPKSAAAYGLQFEQLVDRFIALCQTEKE